MSKSAFFAARFLLISEKKRCVLTVAQQKRNKLTLMGLSGAECPLK